MTDAATVISPFRTSPESWLYRHIPRPRLCATASVAPLRPKRIVVFIKGQNPSFDYYLTARLRAYGISCEVRCIDRDGLDGIDPDGLLVIICRYIRPRQMAWIKCHRGRLAGVAYFVDDDIAALATDGENDLGYRLYLSFFACLPMMALEFTHQLVSTPNLAHALGTAATTVLAPAPIIENHMPLDCPREKSALKIVYHATNTHHREHAFLVPILEEVMRRRPGASLEIVAGGRSNDLWRRASIPHDRMRILRPMNWPDYHRHSREEGADIALMPLLDGLANDSRADTKLIDCFRMGAAPLLSDAAPYRTRNSGIFMVTNTPENWIEGLLALIDNADRRNAAREAARARVLAMTIPAQPFPGIFAPAGGEASP